MLPVVSGEAKDERTLTASTGTWTGTPTITFGYQWESCNSAGEGCAAISGATGASYVVGHEEVGDTIRVKVTAKNGVGEAAVSSVQTATVVAAAPANTVLPVVSGEAKDERTLTASTGTWTGTPTITFGYQWESCNSAGEGCAAISGATGASYVVGHEEVGDTIRVKVTAKNGVGEAAVSSVQTATVVAVAPANTVLPVVSGEAKDERTLTASTGTWTGTPTITFGYQWESCNSAGEGCAAISGATGASYVVGHEEVGDTIRVKVTAKNGVGEAAVSSVQTATVVAAAPADTVLPVVSGEAKDERTLTASTGTWTGTPTITFGYQWESCNSAGEGCAAISGATGASYVVGHEEVGDTIRVKVTAKNGVGEAAVSSVQTATVVAAAPADTVLPVVSGEAKDERTLTASTGTWTGTPTITFGYQWESCNSAGEGCAAISGATGASYVVGHEEVGDTIRVKVTAKNGVGEAAVSSVQTATVVAAAPADTVLPVVSGEAKDERTLTASTGTWTGTPTITFGYQWESCNSAGEGCAAISGATGASYVVGHEEVGDTIRVKVTAKNGVGEAAVSSVQTATVVAAAPADTVLPVVSGEAKDERTLTASTGTWTGTPTITFGYQWESCNSAGEGCAAISGATGASYVVGHEEVGDTIRVKVTAKNGVGEAAVSSVQTATVVAAAPADTVLPVVSGEAKDERTLTASTGTWTGTPTITFGYQWESCNSAGEGCAAISGATGASYVVGHEEVGDTIRVKVTAKNGVGEAAVSSVQTATVVAAAPADTVLPVVSGEAKDERTLTASTGTWTGTPTITFGYQWESCNSAGEGCAAISGATGASYVVGHEEVGDTIRVKVTAKNGVGEASASSTQTATVAAASPVNTAAPVISGTAKEGHTLTASTGAWVGTPQLTYAFQWQSCNSLGVGCLNISGATNSTRLLGAGEVGETVRVAVTASNAAGSSSSTSEATGVVAESPCTDTWTGGHEGEWQTPGDWSTGNVPGTTDVACVEPGSTVTVASGTDHAGLLLDEGTLAISGGSLELASNSGTSTVGALVLSGGVLSVAGELGVSGSLASSGSVSVSGGGRLVVQSGATGTVEGCRPLVLDGVTLANEGTVRTGVAGGGEHGELRLEGGAVLQNSGTFDEDTYDNEECWEGHAIEGLGSSSSVVNSGTFNVEVGSGRTAEVSAAFENTGTVDVGSGTFTPTGGGGSSGGTWVTGSGAAVAFTAGSYSLTGADAMAASVHVVSGTLVATGASSTVGALVLSGGVLSVAGELGVSGSLASSGSVSVNGGGRLVVQSGASGTIDVPGCSLLSLTGVTLVNDGTMTMGSAGGSAGQIDMSEGAQLQNAGMFDADAYSASCVPGSNNAAIQTNTGTTSLTNTGTLNINPGSANTTIVSVPYSGAGAVSVAAGGLQLGGGGSSSDAAWSVASGSQTGVLAGIVRGYGRVVVGWRSGGRDRWVGDGFGGWRGGRGGWRGEWLAGDLLRIEHVGCEFGVVWWCVVGCWGIGCVGVVGVEWFGVGEGWWAAGGAVGCVGDGGRVSAVGVGWCDVG